MENYKIKRECWWSSNENSSKTYSIFEGREKVFEVSFLGLEKEIEDIRVVDLFNLIGKYGVKNVQLVFRIGQPPTKNRFLRMCEEPIFDVLISFEYQSKNNILYYEIATCLLYNDDKMESESKGIDIANNLADYLQGLENEIVYARLF